MEATNETGKNPAGAQSRAGEAGANLSAGLERDFEAWWESLGQFLRAGGGQYEKTFAYHAWTDSAQAECLACANVCRDRAAAASIACDAGSYYEAEECEDAILKRSNVKLTGSALLRSPG